MDLIDVLKEVGGMNALLSRPNELVPMVEDLIEYYQARDFERKPQCSHVVGLPHTLVYEIARQLNAIAVVAEYPCMVDGPGELLVDRIPDSATVLFVADDIKDRAILEVVAAVRKAGYVKPTLPYLLCLVNSIDQFPLSSDELHLTPGYMSDNPWKIVSLHQTCSKTYRAEGATDEQREAMKDHPITKAIESGYQPREGIKVKYTALELSPEEVQARYNHLAWLAQLLHTITEALPPGMANHNMTMGVSGMPTINVIHNGKWYTVHLERSDLIKSPLEVAADIVKMITTST